MKYLVNTSDMEAIDKYAINEIMIPAMVLMERAAMAVVDCMLEKVTVKDKILVVCGTGNNGGDGVAVARMLKDKGLFVHILIIGDEKRGTDQMKQQLVIAKKLGVPVFNNSKISEYNVVVDAIFGIGLSKPVQGAFENAVKEINSSDNIVYSIDIPSGISGDSGKVMGVAVKADVTVTFGVYKLGIVLYPGCEYAGEIKLADIGFTQKAIDHIKCKTFTYEPEDLEKIPLRKKYSNKGNFGKVLIIAGSKNMCGACILSAKAAYRTGTGIVKVLTVEENRNILQENLPEAILTTYEPANLKSKLEVDRLLKEIEWATTIVIGPGIGVSSASAQLLDIVMENTKVPMIVDADGINLLSGKNTFASKEKGYTGEIKDIELPENIILTPHLREMSRLLDLEVTDIIDNLLKTAIDTVENKKFVLALKDARTIVTNGDKVYINTSGNNGMAKGGSGDILTGIIAGLIAQGMENYEATVLGVYIHGMAADKAAEEKSVYSLMASDIIEALPKVFNMIKRN